MAVKEPQNTQRERQSENSQEKCLETRQTTRERGREQAKVQKTPNFELAGLSIGQRDFPDDSGVRWAIRDVCLPRKTLDECFDLLTRLQKTVTTPKRERNSKILVQTLHMQVSITRDRVNFVKRLFFVCLRFLLRSLVFKYENIFKLKNGMISLKCFDEGMSAFQFHRRGGSGT